MRFTAGIRLPGSADPLEDATFDRAGKSGEVPGGVGIGSQRSG